VVVSTVPVIGRNYQRRAEMPGKDRKRWTVLIYMVADDPRGGELLDRQAVREMDYITKAALSVENPEDLHVALQVDFRTLPGVWRRVIGHSTFIRPEGDAADPETLYGFFDWAVNACPAEHYLLIFWGHSRGQFGLFGDPDPFEYTAQTLTLNELDDALRAANRSLGQAVDVIAFKDCFMATLETAYQLSGLADYLLASPGLVPVEGWPYDEMFGALTERKGDVLKKAKQLLEALRKHYEKDENKRPFKEVPYSLLSTLGAATVVAKLADLIGKDRRSAVKTNEERLRATVNEAATKAGDPALVDLFALVQGAAKHRKAAGKLADKESKQEKHLKAAEEAFEGFEEALGAAAAHGKAEAAERSATAPSDRLVIKHTGENVGGVGAFVFPSSPKAQRDSRLTRLADEKIYRSLAISTDTNWAEIALRSMPVQPAQPARDLSAAIARLERLERLGVGMAPGSVAADVYLRRLAQRTRAGTLTEADVARAAEYTAVAELASRLAAFAAGKGTDGFGGKGTDGFGDKGTDGFGDKGTDGFGDKGTDGFGDKGTDGFGG
jgi:hypothetical protein